MAKELPYFKFEPNQWENGNIQMLSREDKGLFIDICSMYWSRLGDLPSKLVVQKLCGGNALALKSLYEEKIIKEIDGTIYIDFLSIQLQEFENTRSQNSRNAKERWKNRGKQDDSSGRNAGASNSHCETDAIREEEKREDKIKEDKKIEAIASQSQKKIEDKILVFKESLIHFSDTNGGKYPPDMIEKFFTYWSELNKSRTKMRWQLEKTFEVEKRLATWANRDKSFNSKLETEQNQTNKYQGLKRY